MAKSRSIKDKTRMTLWGKAAGRCEICNKILYEDSFWCEEENFSENAHIKAFGEMGPRHDDSLSDEELNDVNNLMLLCAEHHKLIDSKENDFSVEYLQQLKAEHEERIRTLTEILYSSSCTIVTFFHDISNVEVSKNERLFRRAVVKDGMIPSTDKAIQICRRSSPVYQSNAEWIVAKASEIEADVEKQFRSIVEDKETIAVFAFAPMPLLIKLGTLLSDQQNIRVFQKNRVDGTWVWLDDDASVDFVARYPSRVPNTKVALVVDLSAEVIDSRVTDVIGEDCSIYHLTIKEPNRDFVRNPRIQDEFVQAYRTILERIRNENPDAEMIHLFPVVPNSLAVRIGMDTMRKIDLPLLIYDQMKQGEPFIQTIMIGE